MAYMFFLLQITVVRGFVQQRLVSNKIENILKADPTQLLPYENKNGQKTMKADTILLFKDKMTGS